MNACVDNPLTEPDLTRLPKNQKEGSMPHIALTTGACDDIGCLLAKVGIDPSEFGAEADGSAKAVHVYSSTSFGLADGFADTSPANTLWTSPDLLATHDIGVFSCECTEAPDTKGTYGGPSFRAVTDYLNHGGRIFTTDCQYVWYRYSPDPGLGALGAADLDTRGIGVITGSLGTDDNPLLLDETFPRFRRLQRRPRARGKRGLLPLHVHQPVEEDEAMVAFFFFFDLASCIQDEAAPVEVPR